MPPPADPPNEQGMVPESPPPRHSVLHIIDSLDLGGAQEALENLVRFRDQSRFDIEVASMHRHGVYSDRIRALGVPVHSLSPNKFIPLYVPRLVALILRRRFDIVHCHLTWANLIAKPLARMCGVRLLFNHDQTNEKFRRSGGARFIWDKLANRLSTHVFAVSKTIADFLVSHEGVPASKVSIVHNGIDLDRFPFRSWPDKSLRSKWGFADGDFVVGGVGRLHPQKNFRLFLEVARAMHDTHPRLRFIIAGDGPERAELQRLASNFALDGTVRFLGFVPDTSELFPALDVLMMTSDYEGLPMTLLEAMACGATALCSEVDGIGEIITDGATGFLATPGDCASFCRQLVRILDAPELCARVSGKARNLVAENFSAQRMTAFVESAYLRYATKL
jgi:glycosyltransferase involved in cell wall biosynthesis